MSQWRESFSTVRANAQNSESYTVTLGEWNRTMRRIKAWKAPGPDGVRNIRRKILPAASKALRSETERLLAGRAEIPAELTIGRTILIYKKGDTRDPANYRPIACLNTAYKCITTVASDYLLNHLLQTGALPDAQRALRTRRRGTWDCLVMDSLVTMDAKLARKDLTVAWFDYKKAYDRVPHTVVDMTLRTVGAPTWLRNIVRKLSAGWGTKYEMRVGHRTNTTNVVNYKRGLFQGDSLAPVLFVLAIAPISFAFEKLGGYHLRSGVKITHMFYMDDLKTFAATKAGAEQSLVMATRVSKAVGMEMGHSKCAVAHLRCGRPAIVHIDTGEIPRLHADSDTYQYLGFPQVYGIAKGALKLKARKELLDSVKTIWASALNVRNKIRAYNWGPVGRLRYSMATGVWTKRDLTDLERSVRGIMREHRSWYYNQAVERFLLQREE